MKAQLLKITSKDGKSYRSCVVDIYRNWANWRDIINEFDESEPVWLDGLVLKGGMINADSRPIKVEEND